jgi:hypothetical protein
VFAQVTKATQSGSAWQAVETGLRHWPPASASNESLMQVSHAAVSVPPLQAPEHCVAQTPGLVHSQFENAVSYVFEPSVWLFEQHVWHASASGFAHSASFAPLLDPLLLVLPLLEPLELLVLPLLEPELEVEPPPLLLVEPPLLDVDPPLLEEEPLLLLLDEEPLDELLEPLLLPECEPLLPPASSPKPGVVAVLEQPTP